MLALRGRVWKILGPHLDAIMEGHIGGVIKHAPFCADMLREEGSDYKALILKYTERLFCNPFDEQWVQDTKDRVNEEIVLGHDMRSRPGIMMTILRDFNQRVARGHQAVTSAECANRTVRSLSEVV